MIGNIYFISALAIIGGGLFGFDISSMSAIIPGQPYLCYFNEQGVVNGLCLGPKARYAHPPLPILLSHNPQPPRD